MVEIKSKRTMQEITDDINAAIELSIEQAHAEGEEWDGSIPDELNTIMEGLDIEREAKIDGVIRAIKVLEGDNVRLAAEKKAIDKRIKSKQGKIAGYKNYLEFVLQGNNFESEGGIAKYGKSTKTVYSEGIEQDIKDGIVPHELEAFATTENVTIVKVPKASVKKWLDADGERSLDGVNIVKEFKLKVF